MNSQKHFSQHVSSTNAAADAIKEYIASSIGLRYFDNQGIIMTKQLHFLMFIAFFSNTTILGSAFNASTSLISSGIEILSPVEGDSFSTQLRSTTIQFSWYGDREENLFRISLLSGDTEDRIITSSIQILISDSSKGEYLWEIPNDLFTQTPYKIRISSVHRPEVAAFSGTFIFHSIWELNITEPKKEDTLSVNSSATIKFTRTYPGGTVNIDLLRNNIFVFRLFQTMPTTVVQNTCLWNNIPSTLPADSTYMIRITDSTNCGHIVYSQPFTITNNSSPTLTQFPPMSRPATNVEITIHTLNGTCLKKLNSDFNFSSYPFPQNIPNRSGLYIVKASSGNKCIHKKLLKVSPKL